MARNFRIANLMVGVARPDTAAAPQRLCLITCNDGAHSLVCEPYSRGASAQRGCLITCNDGVHSLVCEPYSRGAAGLEERPCLITCNDGVHSLRCEPYSRGPSPFRWCTMSCLGSTDHCSPNSGSVMGRAIQMSDLADLRRQLQEALTELDDYEAAVTAREPQTRDEIEAAEAQLTSALDELKKRKATLPKK